MRRMRGGEGEPVLHRLALAALAAALAGGCAVTELERRRAATTVPPREDVLVLGDSLVVGAETQGDLTEALADAGFSPAVVAEEGRDGTWAVQHVARLDRVPDIVVVALGTNPSPEPTEFADEVAALVATLRARGAERIAWVTPVHADDERYAARTAVLYDVAAGGDIVVADWHSEARARPEIFAGDRIHYTEEGYGAFADFLVATAAGATVP